MALDVALEGALSQPVIRAFHAVRIALPNHTSLLLDGSGVVSFTVNGQVLTFTGQDDVCGTLAGIEAISEAIATEAPRLQISLMPPQTGGIADLAAVTAQGSSIQVWLGLVNESGTVIGSPELLFSGRLDIVKVTHTGTTRFCNVEVASGFDRMFFGSEGVRLNSQWHQTQYPGETGLDFIANVSKYPVWGIEAGPPKT